MGAGTVTLLRVTTLAAGAGLLALAVLFPPWEYSHPSDPSLVKDGGYHFIASPPRDWAGPRVDAAGYVLQLLCAGVLAGAAGYAAASFRRRFGASPPPI